MKAFALYRLNPPDTHKEGIHKVSSSVPTLEGIIFGDGTTVVKWLTATKSLSVFKTYDDFMSVHGHPEYNSIIVMDREWYVEANTG